LQRLVAAHQEARNKITDEDVKRFMVPRDLGFASAIK
jgi:hypothetical protein